MVPKHRLRHHAGRAGAVLLVLLAGCAGVERDGARLERILAGAVIVDTHIDAPFRIERGGEDLSVRTTSGQFDLERAREGRLGVAFMSIFVPASEDDAGRGLALAEREIGHVEALAARAPDRTGIARCTADVHRLVAEGRLALAMGLENGGPIASDPGAIDRLAARGIRYVTLAHAQSNAFADSSYDSDRRWQGLSPAGVALVRRLNALGVMVDLSHLSDEAARHVLAISTAPPIASHSATRHFTPGFERNLPDDLIRSLAAAGGVVQINFGSTFVSADGVAWAARREEAFRRFREETGAIFGSREARSFLADYRARQPLPNVDVEDVLDHFDHVVRLVGARHVGIGSDFEGAGDALPHGLEDVTAYPNLVRGLIARGYDDEAIRGMLGGNLLRVWAEAERVSAAATGADPCRAAPAQ